MKHLDQAAFDRGYSQAEEEIHQGNLAYKVYGKLVPYWDEVAEYLKSNYGIISEQVGECITDLKVASQADGFNQRMQEEFQSRFSEDVIQSTVRRIERKRKKRKSY